MTEYHEVIVHNKSWKYCLEIIDFIYENRPDGMDWKYSFGIDKILFDIADEDFAILIRMKFA